MKRMNATTQVEFLSSLSQGLPEGHVLVVAKSVQPSGLDAKKQPKAVTFPAWEWDGKDLPEGPWYFSCGAVARPKRGRPHRTIEMTTHVGAFVIDDVGTKVKPEDLDVEPTWEIETSPGNYQWGYALKEWTDDLAGHDALNRALVDTGRQDKGAQGVNRLSRVPGSVNLKPTAKGWKARMEVVRPRCYTLDELAEGFKVELKREKVGKDTIPDLGSKGATDAIHSWLVAEGMVRGKKGGGWIEIECPWPEEHSADPRLTCDYKPLGANASGYRGVRCHHSHGANKEVFYDRFFAEVGKRGGPVNTPYLPDRLKRVTDGMAKVRAKGLEGAAKALEPPPPYQGSLYGIGDLRRLLGEIDLSKMPLVDMGQKAPSRLQPVNYENVEAGLATLEVGVRLNLMTAETEFLLPERIDMRGFGTRKPREVTGMIEAAVIDCFVRSGYRNKREVRDCFSRIANGHYWHPMKAWIESAEWDGQDRLELLLGSVQTPTSGPFRTLFRRWLLQTVEAVCGWERKDESQKGLVFVLVGDQGIGKTRWLMALAPGFAIEGKHLALNGGTAARDTKHEVLQGAIVELGELEATFKKSDVAALKAFITATTDEYRLPYASDWLRRPRCASLCGSVNEGEFLNDPTGGRRFLPLKVTRCFPDHGVDMQQLWAQVHTWWKAGEQWWLTDAETTMRIEHSATFEQTDGVAEQIDDEMRIRSTDPRFTIECGLGTGAIMRVLGLPHTHPLYQARASNALHKYGPARDMRHRDGGKRSWVWRVTGDELRQYNLVPLKPVKA